MNFNNYYPFGSVMDGRSRISSADARYKFTSKERDNETNYDYFGARYYDSRIARWLQVDPLADKYPAWTPFGYCADSPLILIDPNGEDWYINNESGALHWYDGKYDESSTPEGYSWLGENNYFDDNNMYQELIKNGTNALDLTPEESAKFVKSFGFKLAPIESYSYTTTMYYSGGGGQYSTTTVTGEIVWSKLTYAHQNSDWKENSFVLAKIGNIASITKTEFKTYQYNEPSVLVPVFKVLEWLMSTGQKNFQQDRVKTYTWSNYPKDGKLRKYKK